MKEHLDALYTYLLDEAQKRGYHLTVELEHIVALADELQINLTDLRSDDDE